MYIYIFLIYTTVKCLLYGSLALQTLSELNIHTHLVVEIEKQVNNYDRGTHSPGRAQVLSGQHFGIS